jgi:hypothetical protein
VRRVEGDEVMPEQERCTLGELVQLRKRFGKVAAVVGKGRSCIPADCRKPVDTPVVDSDFEVYRQAPRREAFLLRFACRVLCSAFYVAFP